MLVLGAAGGMGRRVAALWRAEAPAAPLRLGVRRCEGLGELAEWPDTEIVTVRREDPASLRAAVNGAAVVINAVGPFIYDPAPLLDACEAAGAHYVDLASEPDFLAAARSWADRPGISIALCPGASTVPGLIEVAAEHVADQCGTAPSCFDIFLSMGSANPLTFGLLASLTLPLGMPLRSSDGARAYRLVRCRTIRRLGERCFGRYPSPFDEHGLMLGGRRLAARFWIGFDRRWLVHALGIVCVLRPHFTDCRWLALVKSVCPLARLAGRFGEEAGCLRVEARDTAGRLLGALDLFAACNGLTIPALPPVWAARALRAGARPGYHALRALVPAEQAMTSLREYGFEIYVERGES